ncbi:hypothetical protein HDU93_008567, partial [Gonapodya sp. JEL0774]
MPPYHHLTKLSSSLLPSSEAFDTIKVYDRLRFYKFYKQAVYSNIVISIFLSLVVVFFVAGMAEKFSRDNDNLTDLFKLILVGLNGTTFCIILWQKREDIKKSRVLVALLFLSFVVFYGAFAFNAHIIRLRFMDTNAVASVKDNSSSEGLMNMVWMVKRDDDDTPTTVATGTISTPTDDDDTDDDDKTFDPYGFNVDYLTL